MPLFTNDMCLLQEGIWIEHQADPKSSKYHLVLCLDLSKGTDGNVPSIGDINNAIHAVANRHGITRSTIAAIDGKPHILEHSSDSVVQDIRIMASEATIVSEQFVAEITRRPFSLDKEFPVRWIIVENPDSHMLFVIGHHVAVDGQSMTVLSSELMGLLTNSQEKLPASSDFSRMHAIERAWTRSSNYAESKEIIAGQLRTQNQTGWPVPASQPEGPRLPYRKIDSWQTFPKSELEEWSQMYGTSWFRVATALVGLVVANVTRPQFRKDEVLAVGFGGRPQDMGNTVGQFANALPVKVGFWDVLTAVGPQQGTFRELVKAVGRNVSAVKKAQMLAPIEVAQACRDLGIGYMPPRVAITYSPKLSDPAQRLFPVEGAWNLFFPFHEYDSEVRCGLVYDPSIFSPDAVQEIRSTFERLVSISKQESVKLSQMLEWLPVYPNLPEPGMNIEGADENPLQHFHHLFDAHAKTRPTALALDCQELGISMTYGELYNSSQHKAKALIERGVCRGDRVVIELTRGFAVVEWIVAILKAGAAFVFLDPEYNKHQKSIILSDCEPKLVVDEKLAAEVRDASSIGLDSKAINVEDTSYNTADNDLAYMIYTSGSTGKPKGVMIEHGNLSAYAKMSTEAFKTGFGGRVLQLATFSFDGSVMELVASLCTGATLCFAQYPKQLVGDYLGEVIKESQITFMHVSPTSLEALAMEGELPSLRQISVGGEPPSRQLFVRWHPYVDLVNTYGPTETAVAVTLNQIDRSSDVPEIMSVGKAPPGTDIYICTEDLKIISRPGAIGEVCIVGAQVESTANSSLHVPKLHKKLKENFPGTKIRVTDLFHQSTIEQQAALCQSEQRKSKAAEVYNSITPSSNNSPSTTPSTDLSVASSFVPVSTPSTVVHTDDGIAVIGIAGRFPGAQDPDSFYKNLLENYLAIVDAPKNGRSTTTPEGNMWVPKAGVLSDIEEFDPEFWHLSEGEATDMDPQQRLFLDVAYEALTDAGYFSNGEQPLVNRKERIGLFVGCANNGYHLHTESVAADPFMRENRGLVAPSISARTSYHLNLTGPNATVQTSCSSGTVALSMACDAIRLGRCDTAVVGGVSVQLFEGGYITRQGQIFSPRGECNPFDARADGTVPADGVVAVVVKRCSLAIQDKTPMYAKILGTSTGSDGALEKAGYQVPSPRGQAEVIKAAWKMAGVSPKNLAYAEIHGSGTPFGDALELEGFNLAMEELGNEDHRFVIGSTKGNIGNTQQASGLVSLIKVIKSMQGGVVPKTLGFETPNETISPDLPIDLASKPTNVGPGDILAVSATGWGGVNSHAVLAFPDAHLHKRTTRQVPAGRFHRRTLAAPRLSAA
ncbi:amino acid adenylation domain protein [Fusarium acuminatum]|uniref:Amino acid adenylation domain protein n=1 Tax=Fusarium acuminatum TaxID=5515 RepID=A0ABZ2X5K1_9HYPO